MEPYFFNISDAMSLELADIEVGAGGDAIDDVPYRSRIDFAMSPGSLMLFLRRHVADPFPIMGILNIGCELLLLFRAHLREISFPISIAKIFELEHARIEMRIEVQRKVRIMRRSMRLLISSGGSKFCLNRVLVSFKKTDNSLVAEL